MMDGLGINSIFDRYYKKYDAWYDKHKFAYLSELEAIKKVLPNKGKGLEIGVGTGRFASSLGIKFGIDPSKKMLAIASKRGINVKLGMGEKLPYKDSSFDYVAIIITLCFVNDPQEVLAQSYRVLKKNGKIAIGIVDKNSFLGKSYQRKESIFYKQANFFSVREVTDLLKETGFKRFSYYQTIFELPDKINSIENPQDGFDNGGFVVVSGEKTAGENQKERSMSKL